MLVEVIMFGKDYANYLDILLDELAGMNKKYRIKAKPSQGIIHYLQKIFVLVFGIPEIGLQLRSLYFKDMLRYVQNLKVKRILDAGSGIGLYTFYLNGLYPRITIDGCDLDRSKLKFCNKIAVDKRLDKVMFLHKDLENDTLGNNLYDLIVNIDVLEHINDYKKTLRNFYKVLKPDGLLYIHTPQINQKRFFKSLKNWTHDDHVREGFEPELLVKDLKLLSFKIVYIKNTFGFFGSLAWELNHILIAKSFILAGLAYPFLYFLGSFDLLKDNKRGLGIALLVRK